jgi:hypothetical protein
VSGLAFGPNKQTLNWDPTPGATRYDLVRGDIALLPVGPGLGDEICIADVAGTSTTDASVPPVGSASWYDLRGENASCTGGFGISTDGAPRTTTTCP